MEINDAFPEYFDKFRHIDPLLSLFAWPALLYRCIFYSKF